MYPEIAAFGGGFDEGLTAGGAVATTEAAFSGRLLVVDDDATIRWLLQRQLERLGFCVDTAENGEAGLRKLSCQRYDAMLTDCHMPIMDGVAFTRAVRALDDPALKNLPIIGLTADVTEAQRARCMEAGMSDVSIKPVSLERLQQIAAFHLSRSAVQHDTIPVALPHEDGTPCFDPKICLSIFPRGDQEGAAWLNAFLTEAQRDAAELRGLIITDRGDVEDSAMVATVAHHLAGSAFSAGAMQLGEAARALEHAALDGASCAGFYEFVHDAVELAEVAISAFLSEAPVDAM